MHLDERSEGSYSHFWIEKQNNGPRMRLWGVLLSERGCNLNRVDEPPLRSRGVCVEARREGTMTSCVSRDDDEQSTLLLSETEGETATLCKLAPFRSVTRMDHTHAHTRAPSASVCRALGSGNGSQKAGLAPKTELKKKKRKKDGVWTGTVPPHAALLCFLSLDNSFGVRSDMFLCPCIILGKSNERFGDDGTMSEKQVPTR